MGRKDERVKLPLSGVKLLAMANWVPGLYCSMLLADLGADIILVEHPSGRERAERPPGLTSVLNRNKRSMTLDLKSPKAKEIFNNLAIKSDVFMEGLRPGATKRIGIDYENLRKINPKIIYCSLSGYGQDGPYRDWPAHNSTYMGIAGMISSFTGFPPTYNRYVPVADLTGSMFAALSIVAALRARDSTDEGQYIDVSILDCTVSWMSGNLGFLFATGHLRPELPASSFYKTKDGRYITLSVGPTDHLWQNLCHVMGLDELANMPRQQREESFEELEQTLQEVISCRTSAEWIKLLVAADAPCGPVLTLDELSSDPHVRHRELIREIEDDKGQKVKQVAHPVRFSETPVEIRKLAPALGENTEEILKDLGYSKEEIDELRSEKAI